MYDNFKLAKTGYGTIEAYLWDVVDPKKVVVIIHGIGEYAGRYDRVAGYLNESGIAVVSMDLRGHGLTEGPKGHCTPRASVFDDLTTLLNYARDKYPGKEIVIYGHSMGGSIALDYKYRGELCDLPSAYIITSPWITLARPIPKPVFRLVKALSKLTPSFSVHSDVDIALLGNEKYVNPYNDNPLVYNRISMACAVDCFEIGVALREGTLGNRGLADNIPTLIMIGSEDRICSPQGAMAYYERAKKAGENIGLIVWKGYCHEIHNGSKDHTGEEVIKKITAFVLDPTYISDPQEA